MPRYKLRTLLILMAVGPMVLAGVFWEAEAFGLEMLLVDAIALGISAATLTFCFLFLFGPR
jgi:hypothetical protein